MRHLKRSNTYTASNVSFAVETEQAYSYGWWRFVDRIRGLLVFNDYRYSPSTSGHQSKVSSLLGNLGKPVDLYIRAPLGLQRLDAAKQHYESMIAALETKINTPGTRPAKNAERRAAVIYLEDMRRMVAWLDTGGRRPRMRHKVDVNGYLITVGTHTFSKYDLDRMI